MMCIWFVAYIIINDNNNTILGYHFMSYGSQGVIPIIMDNHKFGE